MEVDATWDTVTMQGVEKRLGRHQVFSRVSLTAGVGSVLGLIGANGSGKTTLLRLLLGLIRPDSGCIRLYGLPPHLALRHRRAVYFAGGVNGNRKPHICGNRKLHTSGEDVSGGADILPVMPVGRVGLDAGSGATGVLANTRREAAEPAVTWRLPHAVRPTLSSASADAPASGNCCPGC